MSVIIHELGDKSRGISPVIYKMETPFTKEDLDSEELEFFRSNMEKLSNKHSDSRVVVYFDSNNEE